MGMGIASYDDQNIKKLARSYALISSGFGISIVGIVLGTIEYKKVIINHNITNTKVCYRW